MRQLERVTDEQWALIEPHLPKHKPGKKGGRPRAPDRACFEGILWILRTGARWRDLPDEYPSPSDLLASAVRVGETGCLAGDVAGFPFRTR